MTDLLSAAGLILLTFLQEILPSPFAGMLIAVMVYAIVQLRNVKRKFKTVTARTVPRGFTDA